MWLRAPICLCDTNAVDRERCRCCSFSTLCLFRSLSFLCSSLCILRENMLTDLNLFLDENTTVFAIFLKPTTIMCNFNIEQRHWSRMPFSSRVDLKILLNFSSMEHLDKFGWKHRFFSHRKKSDRISARTFDACVVRPHFLD